MSRSLLFQALDLAGSSQGLWLPIEVPQGLQSLRSFSIDVGAILEEFPRLTALTHLHLGSPEDRFGPDDELFGKLFGEFLGLPKLQRLTFDNEVARLIGSAAALDAFIGFLRSMPHLECRSLEEFVLPLASQLVPWDKVS